MKVKIWHLNQFLQLRKIDTLNVILFEFENTLQTWYFNRSVVEIAGSMLCNF